MVDRLSYYFHRLKYLLPESRLCKKVFREMEDTFVNGQPSSWPYMKILTNVGLDNKISSQDGQWIKSYHKLSLDNYVLCFFSEVDSKVSLSLYSMLKRSSFREEYLFTSTNFDMARLKFMARTGCLGLKEDLFRWKLVPEVTCDLCRTGTENVCHLLLTCPILNEIRIRYLHELEAKLIATGENYIWEYFIGASSNSKLCLLLGDAAYDYGTTNGKLFDDISKRLLKETWLTRKSLVDGS